MDRAGKTVDFRLSAKRDVAAAKAFFKKAIKGQGCAAQTVTLDGYAASHRAARKTKLRTLMQSVGRRYVQYFNWHYKRTGTLWEGRYRATIVDAKNYLFECMRYIELNPVRAGMVAHPRQYSWSSYRCNAEGRADAVVSAHSLYRSLAREENERQAAYRTLVKGPMDVQTIDTIRTCTNKGWALGSGKFQSKIERLAERRAAPLSKGRPKSIKAD
jgi:putative transposase